MKVPIQYVLKPFTDFRYNFLYTSYRALFKNKIIIHSAILDIHTYRQICVTS